MLRGMLGGLGVGPSGYGRLVAVMLFLLAAVVSVAGVVGAASRADAAVPYQVTTQPTITGIAKVGDTLTVLPGATTPASAGTYVQWYRNGHSIGLLGTRTPTYTLTGADAGQSITVVATYQFLANDTSATLSATAGPVVVANGTLEETSQPSIEGSPTVGSPLTADPGSTSPEASSVSYQWLRDGAVIDHADKSAYVLSPDDLGSTVSVDVTAQAYGYDPLTRPASGATEVQAGTLQVSSSPVISGTPTVGKQLATTPGVTSPAAMTTAYQWLRNGTPIMGQRGSTYALTHHDLHATISVSITSNTLGYVPLVQTLTSPRATTPGRFTAARTASVSGKAKVGHKLTAHPAVLKPAAANVTYQWLRNGKEISKATKSTYSLTKRDERKKIRVRITYSKLGYKTRHQTVGGIEKVA